MTYEHQLCADTGSSQENMPREIFNATEDKRESENSVLSAQLDDDDDDDDDCYLKSVILFFKYSHLIWIIRTLLYCFK